MSGINILIGAIVAVLFYVLAGWLLTLISFAIPNIVLALIAILIFIGFVSGKINIG